MASIARLTEGGRQQSISKCFLKLIFKCFHGIVCVELYRICYNVYIHSAIFV